MKGAIQV